MIKAILLDVEGTLVGTGNASVFTHSLQLFEAGMDRTAPVDTFAAQALGALADCRENRDPTMTVGEIFNGGLRTRLDGSTGQLLPAFQQFFESGLGDPRVPVVPQETATDLLNWLFDSHLRVVVAADPVMPEMAIRWHLQRSGCTTDASLFHMVAAKDRLHFTKPHARYYDEIVARLDLKPEEALMVGDDLPGDIEAAASAGLHTFWVTNGSAREPMPGADGQGTLGNLLDLLQDGEWLASLKPRKRDWQSYQANLLGTLAAIDSLMREVEPEQLMAAPTPREWSMRDAICHLRDHEIEVDRPRLRQVSDEDDPFLSATSYDPQAHTAEYEGQDAREALRTLAERRVETVAWLESLPAEAWERPARHSVFGPTTLGELVKFMSEHDRIHLRQMRTALASAGWIAKPDQGGARHG